MNGMAQRSKLAQLRGRTDRQLADIIGNDLDQGFVLAGIAEAHYSLRDWTQGEQAFQRAMRACEEGQVLFPLVYDLNAEQRERLSQRLEELRDRLESVSAGGVLRPQACC